MNAPGKASYLESKDELIDEVLQSIPEPLQGYVRGCKSSAGLTVSHVARVLASAKTISVEYEHLFKADLLRLAEHLIAPDSHPIQTRALARHLLLDDRAHPDALSECVPADVYSRRLADIDILVGARL